jgi:hypothetical protein
MHHPNNLHPSWPISIAIIAVVPGSPMRLAGVSTTQAAKEASRLRQYLICRVAASCSRSVLEVRPDSRPRPTLLERRLPPLSSARTRDGPDGLQEARTRLGSEGGMMRMMMIMIVMMFDAW